MAPKQATLGYVKSGQQTLGKFFGDPNGGTPHTQQSKLAFKNKTSKKEEEAVNGDSDDVKKEENGHETMGDPKDVDMTDGASKVSPKAPLGITEAKPKAEKSDPSSPEQNLSPDPPKRSKAEMEEELEEDDDDEPVRKRSRKNGSKPSALTSDYYGTSES